MLTLLLQRTYDFDIVKVSPVLDACPLLRYLDLVKRGTFSEEARGSGIRSPLSPTYHTKLKEVRFGGFSGTREEIEFAIYILRSAMVLELMILSQYLISPHHNVYSGYDIWKERERERISIERQLHVSSNVEVMIE
ncbi:hypothetical protein RND71_012858 [Anisodus tanguticus]|uniref:FBD domain-containing protein n=1 Tax=Anisodus tanguticus TaxID=243964 RepID=A0AAE1SHW9_9SOLA|nr:hypothetical protein RND71_012858 [Anisodus tanguticus]